ncbi:rRNA-processing protein FCF1 like protein [Tupaia chinensis]|uniref:rRNA-processing protein FCF1 like protein n=1 Tax=Tupaia chinensis TaxID=246437 RepID=L9KR65_TUPCH|nr:rRNA-processing protein FCF1 like protein [Tupaia chinensis]
MLNLRDQRLKEKDRLKPKKKDKKDPSALKERDIPQHPSCLFFQYNTQLGPPYHILVDTNFIHFSIKAKLDLLQTMIGCLPSPTPPHAQAGPRNPAATGAALQGLDAGITWVWIFAHTLLVDVQAPRIWKRAFRSGRRQRPRNLLQFKLSAFLVPAPDSVSRAFERIDRGCQATGIRREWIVTPPIFCLVFVFVLV